MRPLALLTAVASAAVLASCGSSGPPRLEACSPGRAAPAPKPPPPRRTFVGITQAAPGAPAVLARLDPLSLKPVSRRVVVAEYHNAWSLSPDASEVALGVSAGESVLRPPRAPERRIGIYVVDLRTMRVVQEVQTGVAAEGIGWLRPRRLVAALQRGGTVLVDPRTGRVVRRWPGFSFPDASVLTPIGLVMVFPTLRESTPNVPLTRVSGTPRLAIVDGNGQLRSVTLERIHLLVHSSHGILYEDRAGLAVDAEHARAYVVARDARIAVVDLRTMHVSYHLNPADPGAPEPGTATQRGALWLGDDRIAIYGRDIASRFGGLTASPAGVTLVDTRDWDGCKLDGQASQAILAGDRLITYGPGSPVSAEEPGAGVRAYDVDGREAFRLFGDQRIRDVAVAGGRAYVQTSAAVRVIDIMSGELDAASRGRVELVDVLGFVP